MRELLVVLCILVGSAVAGTAAGGALVGCGLLASEAAVPAAVSGLEALAELVRRQVGKELDEVAMVCEHENSPADGTLLMLCTVCYDLAPGESCE